ncbi:MAG: hypothetical protein A3H96_25610 [Acidobacteria bacterium RIFCSPLOWO2_02_FULL_67_36]|nr:MAG: hypothetical protein A3H96_25610 [Acidobacteria bacterium RIFCSPLOWO2_02_FULL_67_36]OFW22550.1 MAG: hypothetical protein A3G21_13820 [Acidobacteria bacterium RIFCSPLOWO2_12_FULL_66_21]
MNGEIAVLVGLVLLMAALLHWLPTWRRRGLWFSVTVPPGFDTTAEARAALRRYRAAVWSLSLVAIACVVGGGLFAVPALPEAGVLCQAIGASAAYATVRRRVLPFAVPASGARSAAISTDPDGLPGGAASLIVPVGMLAATALYLHANWQRLPERVPVHWGLDGTPNGWADRTWHGVYGPLILCAVIGLIVLLMAEAIIHASPRARVAGTEAWTRRFRRANVILLVAGVWGVSAMMSLFALTPLFTDVTGPPGLVWMIPLVLVVSILPFTWQLVRVVRERDSGSDGTPDACWKLGLIYYNPEDSALMVEKRFGIGYTVNFGNRTLWWIVGVAALVILLVNVAW